jgi:hypothetical protein
MNKHIQGSIPTSKSIRSGIPKDPKITIGINQRT